MIYTGYSGFLAKILIYILGILNLLPDKCRDFNYQKDNYRKNRWKYSIITNILYYFQNFFAPYAGVPKSQLNLYDTSSFWSELCDHLNLYTDLYNDNYFYHGYLFGGFWNTTPDWLTEDNYELIKSRLDRIKIFNGKIEDMIEKSPNGFFTKINLLDHMDWLNDREVRREWEVITRKVSTNCKIMWRSFSKKYAHMCLADLPYNKLLETPRCRNPVDRIGMYNSLLVSEIDKDLIFKNKQETKYDRSYIQDIIISLKILKIGLMGGSLIEGYKYQSEYYNNHRSRMLHGKKELFNRLVFKKNERVMVVAGGTCDILDRFPIEQLKDVKLTDISEPLLDNANKMKEKNGWGDNVKIINEDVCKLNEEDKYDMIIITYSLTMIPDWKLTLKKIHTALKKKGRFIITDYISHKNSWWSLWFKQVGIYLNEEHIEEMKNLYGEPIWLERKMGGFPLCPSFITCPYYYGYFRK